MSFITGTYDVATWDNAPIGQTEAGFRVRKVQHKEDILTDSGGDAPVDGVIRGAEYEVTCDFVEYDALQTSGLLDAATLAGDAIARVGMLLVGQAHELILTAKAGTSAATLDGVGRSWVFYKAIIVSDIDVLMANKLRKGPITIKAYPDPDHSNKAYEIITTPASGG